MFLSSYKCSFQYKIAIWLIIYFRDCIIYKEQKTDQIWFPESSQDVFRKYRIIDRACEINNFETHPKEAPLRIIIERAKEPGFVEELV